MEVLNGKIDGWLGDDTNLVIYIGRKNQYYGFAASPLANPYQVNSSRSLDESLLLYKQWLLQMYSNKGSVYNELVRLAQLKKEGQNVKLACWCSPNKCHGDIIVQIVNFMLKNKIV